MTFFNQIKNFADHIDGQFTEYDENRSVIVVPLAGRYQTVLASTKKSPVSGKEQAILSSKVCEVNPTLDLKMLLEQSANFDYSKFIIEDGYLKIEASSLSASVLEEQIREMIQEVAQLADHYELKLTGKDVF